MRDYLFRGKLVHSKEWVEGSLIISRWDNPYIYPNEIIEQDGHHIQFDSDAPFFVIPETVGQFTGLFDKNGVKIFEGDMIKFLKWDNEGGGVFPVVWDSEEARFCLDVTNYKDIKQPYEDKHYWHLIGSHVEAMQMVVIGNTHDNLELLEGIK